MTNRKKGREGDKDRQMKGKRRKTVDAKKLEKEKVRNST